MTTQGNMRPEASPDGSTAVGKRSGWRRFFHWKPLLASFLVLVLVVGLAGGAFYQTTPIPDANQAAMAQTSTVYYADGKTVLGTFSSANRTNISLAAMPSKTREALIASEDRTFYTNSGVSLRGTVRAFWNNLTGGSQQGGSTITQQYVKNYYLNSSKTYTRKLREAMISLKLDHTMSKDDILKNYLNTVYFGRGAYGLEAAAQTFWGVPAKRLSIAQGALLVAILPSPSYYDPATNPTGAKDRWNRVLDSMVRDNYLTQAERDKQKFPAAPVRRNRNVYQGSNGYLLTAVRDELEKAGLDDSQIDGGGLKIVSTFNADMQSKLNKTMSDADVYPKNRPKYLHAAVSTVDPTSGAVRAMYGGSDYLARQRNAATQDVVQAGSTFKPFTLLAALDKGYSLNSTFSGANRRVFPGYPQGVKNFGGESMGYINMTQALTHSVNTVFVDLNNQVGPKETQLTAIRAGLPQNTAGLNDYLSNVLGAASPHNIDMATAYATFAADGVRHQSHFVDKVTGVDPSTNKNKTFYTGPTEGTKVFDADKVNDLVYAMQQVVRQGTGARASALGRPVAGKTGTSENSMSAWFVGFTPQLTTAVSLFQTDAKGNPAVISPFGGYGSMQGGGLPASIWTSYMRKAVDGMEVKSFPDPSFGGTFKGTYVPPPTRARPSASSSSPTSSSATQTQFPTPTWTQQPTWTPTQTWTQQPTWTPTQTWTNGNGNGNGGNGQPNGGNGAVGTVVPAPKPTGSG